MYSLRSIHIIHRKSIISLCVDSFHLHRILITLKKLLLLFFQEKISFDFISMFFWYNKIICWQFAFVSRIAMHCCCNVRSIKICIQGQWIVFIEYELICSLIAKKWLLLLLLNRFILRLNTALCFNCAHRMDTFYK